MTLSNSTDWTLTRDQLINMALRKLRAIDPFQTTNATILTDAGHALNMMLKAWQLDELDIWLSQEIVVFMDAAAEYYNLGPTGDQAAELRDSVKTQLAAAVAASGKTLTVDSITGIANTDKIGICLDDGTIHWDVVDGAPSGTTVVITTGLASAAAVDNYLFAYTTAITRPIEITEARLRDVDDNDSKLTLCTDRNEFFRHTDKTTSGETLEVFYEPISVNGRLYVWPVAGDSEITDRIILSTKRTIYDMDSGSDNFDLPNEVLQAAVWGLANELQPEYGMADQSIAARAMYYYEMVKRRYRRKQNFFFRP